MFLLQTYVIIISIVDCVSPASSDREKSDGVSSKWVSCYKKKIDCTSSVFCTEKNRLTTYNNLFLIKI